MIHGPSPCTQVPLPSRKATRAVAITQLCLAASMSGAHAGNLFDGTYRGSQHAVKPEYCGYVDRPESFIIADGHFSIKLGAGRKDVEVTSDGTFWAAALVGDKPRWMAIFHGQIINDELVADIDSSHCAVHIYARKVQ